MCDRGEGGLATVLAHSGAGVVNPEEFLLFLLIVGAFVGVPMTLIALGLTLGMGAQIRSGYPTRSIPRTRRRANHALRSP